MVPEPRRQFNENFTEEKYIQYLQELSSIEPGSIEFRVAETPVFCDKAFTEKMLSACESIVDVIVSDDFRQQSEAAIPAEVRVPNENNYTQFIAFDFGICENDAGQLEPQLIEMQGFPTLFAFQPWQIELVQKHFNIPANYDAYLNGFNKQSYIQLLKEIIVGDYAPEQVVLLEILPHQQKTRIDFYCTREFIGINIVDLADLIKKGDQLYYINNGVETRIKRIYNRVIFDDLQQQSDEMKENGKILFQPLDVEWVPHPNWFYRISKHTLPSIQHPYVPHTIFLNQLQQIPTDLSAYVLKPLFSFAGQGVIIDIEKGDIENIKDPENWILQRKVRYADVIDTPDGKAKAEIRIFYFWKPGDPRPVATNNLARISKGKMIGVRYNKDKTWVGGTVAFFER